MLETIILIGIVMLFTIVDLVVGVMIGQRMNKEIHLPEPKQIATKIPFTKEHKAVKEQSKEINTLNQIWDNINNFDGTKESQKEVR